MKPDIYKVKEIGEGCLYVMAKPVSGDWIEDEFKNISFFGIDTIVSLLENLESREVGLSEEGALSRKNNMEFISFPIRDRGLPSSVSEYTVFINSLYQQLISGKNVVVHCRAGIGRTGIVAASILIKSGTSPSEAFSLVSQKRGVSVPDTEAQREWVQEICGKL